MGGVESIYQEQYVILQLSFIAEIVMKLFHSQLKLGFEFVTGTRTVTSKRSPGPAFEFKRQDYVFSQSEGRIISNETVI